MDKLIYVAMTGAKQAMEQQATTANNLANVNTTGFRAQLDQFRAVPVLGEGLATRAFVVDSTVGSNLAAGSIRTHWPRPGCGDPGLRLDCGAGSRWQRGLHPQRRPAAE